MHSSTWGRNYIETIETKYLTAKELKKSTACPIRFRPCIVPSLLRWMRGPTTPLWAMRREAAPPPLSFPLSLYFFLIRLLRFRRLFCRKHRGRGNFCTWCRMAPHQGCYIDFFSTCIADWIEKISMSFWQNSVDQRIKEAREHQKYKADEKSRGMRRSMRHAQY